MSPRAQDPDAAIIARRLMRGCDGGALATSFEGAPYASLVLVAADLDASPLLLLSDLAQHSRNIAFDPRVSLLFDGTAGRDDPLTGPRLTLLGRAEAVAAPGLRERFVRRHPTSAAYAGFADFRLYRVAAERGHLVAGFGRIEWIDGCRLKLGADAEELAATEAAIVAEINRDRAELIASIAKRSLGRTGDGWQLTGLDPEGADLRCGGETARLDFATAAATPEAARAKLCELVDTARK
ncbi:MAG: HugZ family protein [Stellaceae bacterium]